MTTHHGFPFSAVVGQDHARAALLLATIDPAIGGVLLRGDKGSAKSTLARGLAALLPDDAAFVELPLGATEDRVLGSLDLHAALHAGEVEQFRPGLLAQAHGGVLYVDEVNLLPDHLVDALLDAAASGINRVERDGISHEHAARFVLVGSMNPEEGELRPQLLDRFGLAVEVRTPDDPELRAEAVRRRLTYDAALPDHDERAAWQHADDELRRRLTGARLAGLSADVVRFAAHTAVEVGAESLRADLVLCRAAAALAAWEGRDQATTADVARVAPLVLAHRRRRRPFEPPTLPDHELASALDRARAGAAAAAAETRPEPAPSTSTPPDLEASLYAGRNDDNEDAAPAAPADPAAPPYVATDWDDTDPRDPDRPYGADADAEPDDYDDSQGEYGDADQGPGRDPYAGGDRLAPERSDPFADDDTEELLATPLGTSDPRPSASTPAPTGPSNEPADTAPVPTARWEDLADGALTADPPPLTTPPSTTGSTPATAPGRPQPVRPSAARPGDTRHRTTPTTRHDGGPRGRAIGDRPADADDTSGDIAVVPTVRAALRRRATDPSSADGPDAAPLVQPDDLRSTQRARHLSRTVVFVLDTSGSMGTTERVNAASGAVLGLLADAYLRRDRVALVAFRGSGASEVLPPTGSVELARSRLGDLETGGATPLAEGIASALTVAQRVRSNGSEPLLVLLTDGRATGDAEALDRARSAASKVADTGVDAVILDAEDEREPLGLAKELSALMGARYLHLSEISAPAVEIAVRNSL